MNYQTYRPHYDLESIVKFYWTLEVPFDSKNQKQKIVPDGCIEMTFNFGDKIKRYTSENDFILHPNAMVMGQRTKSYYICKYSVETLYNFILESPFLIF